MIPNFGMKPSLILLFCCCLIILVRGQEQSASRFADVTLGAGSFRGTFSASVGQQWGVFPSKKLSIGLGARFTSLLGANLYYITAPAKLTSGQQGPLVIFKENIAENIDSFLIKSPQVNALNLMMNIEYRTGKIDIGFNIDFIGFSFGGKTRGNYMNGPFGKNTDAKPSAFNLLLISDNDKGTLNSEIFIRYSLTDKIKLKVAGQFLFTEYTTDENVQQYPEMNDRFRNKSLLFACGVTKIF
jgi:hypothetical protein